MGRALHKHALSFFKNIPLGRYEVNSMSEKVIENQFQITGMTCAACANRIEKGLKKMDGVKEANVNLALEKAMVQFDSAVMSPTDITNKVKDLGYDVITDTQELEITGMTCAACSTRVEKGLNKMDGVLEANVNLALERATVEYNPTAISAKDLIKKVEDLGYGAMVKTEENQKEAVDYRQKEIEKQQGKFIFSAFYHFRFFGQWPGILALPPLFGYQMRL